VHRLVIRTNSKLYRFHPRPSARREAVIGATQPVAMPWPRYLYLDATIIKFLGLSL